MPTTHYQTLGVAQGATTDEIRQAYRRLARELHPDRHLSSPPEEAAVASRRMQDVNAAWSVLSNDASRELYDLELNLARIRSTPSGASSTGPSNAARPTATAPPRNTYDPVTYAPARPGTVVFRGLPWVIVLVVLGFIFVFTAFAAGGGNDAATPTTTTTAPPPPKAGDCVRFLSATEIGLVDCAAPHDGEIAQIVPFGRPCASDTTGVYLPDLAQYACVRRT